MGVSPTDNKRKRAGILILLTAAMLAGGPRPGMAASAEELTRDSKSALAQLREGNLIAEKLADTAKGVLVFPGIIKAGFMFGGQVGEGVLLKAGHSAGYYNSVAASYGLQAGIQRFGYAMFFMDDQSLAGFEASTGFEIGVGPSIVVVDEGVGKTLSSTTVRDGIYAFIFDQKGLMAGLGIQGSKITRISK
jgi:lipid-binding SYLF domain-containing protein